MAQKPTRLSTLRGSDGASLPALAFDTASVQSVSVTADVEATVQLDPGIYYAICRDTDFSFTHGVGDTSGYIGIPWFKDVYLELVIVEDSTLSISMPSGVSGSLIIVPAREHD